MSDYRITNGIWEDFIHDCNERESWLSDVASDRAVENTPFSVEYLLDRFHSFDQFYSKFVLFYDGSGIVILLTHSLNHSLTHSLTFLRTYLFTYSPVLTYSLTHTKEWRDLIEI